MEPAPEETLHTALPDEPVVVAVNCSELPTPTELPGALIEIDSGATSVMVSFALTVLSVESFAVTTTLALEGIDDGAV